MKMFQIHYEVFDDIRLFLQLLIFLIKLKLHDFHPFLHLSYLAVSQIVWLQLVDWYDFVVFLNRDDTLLANNLNSQLQFLLDFNITLQLNVHFS